MAESKRIEIDEGDFVRVSGKGANVDMSPNALISAGWPNGQFMVLAKWRGTPKGSPKPVECATLWPCCRFLRNAATGEYFCDGHPLSLFAKVDPQPEPVHKKPVAQTAVDGPTGEVADLSYYDGQAEVPTLVLSGLTKRPISIKGVLAKGIAELLRKGELL